MVVSCTEWEKRTTSLLKLWMSYPRENLKLGAFFHLPGTLHWCGEDFLGLANFAMQQDGTCCYLVTLVARFHFAFCLLVSLRQDIQVPASISKGRHWRFGCYHWFGFWRIATLTQALAIFSSNVEKQAEVGAGSDGVASFSNFETETFGPWLFQAGRCNTYYSSDRRWGFAPETWPMGK